MDAGIISGIVVCMIGFSLLILPRALPLIFSQLGATQTYTSSQYAANAPTAAEAQFAKYMASIPPEVKLEVKLKKEASKIFQDMVIKKEVACGNCKHCSTHSARTNFACKETLAWAQHQQQLKRAKEWKKQKSEAELLDAYKNRNGYPHDL